MRILWEEVGFLEGCEADGVGVLDVGFEGLGFGDVDFD